MSRIDISYTGINEEGIVDSFSNHSLIIRYPCSTTSCSPYKVTLKPGIFKFECWGASGYNQSHNFSQGGYSSGFLTLSKTTIFYVYIGSQGILNGGPSFNGGGRGTLAGFSGGGSTDVRLLDGPFWHFESLLSRIIVAGGGGGFPQWGDISNIIYYGDYCNSGGLIGGRGIIRRSPGTSFELTFAKGGNQTHGGSGSECINPCQNGQNDHNSNGILGLGGNSTHTNWGSGGGGGYFGGGAGHVDNNIVGGGGGGSSYISGYDGCHSMSPSSTINNLIPNPISIHSSNHLFSSSHMGIGRIGHGQFQVSDFSNQIFNFECTTQYGMNIITFSPLLIGSILFN